MAAFKNILCHSQEIVFSLKIYIIIVVNWCGLGNFILNVPILTDSHFSVLYVELSYGNGRNGCIVIHNACNYKNNLKLTMMPNQVTVVTY